MNEFLRKFDTIRFVAPWSIFTNFFGNFSFFWIQIWILNLGRFGTGPNRNRAGPVWPVTGQTGPVPSGFANPGFSTYDRTYSRRFSSGWRSWSLRLGDGRVGRRGRRTHWTSKLMNSRDGGTGWTWEPAPMRPLPPLASRSRRRHDVQPAPFDVACSSTCGGDRQQRAVVRSAWQPGERSKLNTRC